MNGGHPRMSRDALLEEFAAAYERVIEAARDAAKRGVADSMAEWGPRAVIAHLAGWEIMANVRIPAILGGMPPMEMPDEEQDRVMNDAINRAFITLAKGQSLDVLVAALREAYQRTIALLLPVPAGEFRPGTYVYERTLGVIDHCEEHVAVHLGGDDTRTA